MREQAEVGEALEPDLADHEPADGQPRMRRDAVLAAATQHHHDARPVGRLQREHRRRRVETALAGSGHPQCHPLLEGRELDGARPQLTDVDLSTVRVGDPRRQVAVHVDFLDPGVAEIRLERTGSREFSDDAGPRRRCSA